MIKFRGLFKVRFIIQIFCLVFAAAVIIAYYAYISGLSDFMLLSIGDLNPYGGWSAVYGYITDPDFVWLGFRLNITLTIAMIAAAWMGGRFFCGWICPLGTLQEISNKLGQKAGISQLDLGKSKVRHLYFLKYIILLGVVIIWVSGGGAWVAIFSPWRALLGIGGGTGSLRQAVPGMMILGGTVLFSTIMPRIFCRYLCPLGATQALVSAVGVSGMYQSSDCSECGRCFSNCPVGIGREYAGEEISPECIRCLECMEHQCTKSAAGTYLKLGKWKVNKAFYIILIASVFCFIWLGIPQAVGKNAREYTAPAALWENGIYSGEGKGFGGIISVKVLIKNHRIESIMVEAHKESAGWYELPFKHIKDQMILKQTWEVDSISGATKTSKGLKEGVSNALKKAEVKR